MKITFLSLWIICWISAIYLVSNMIPYDPPNNILLIIEAGALIILGLMCLILSQIKLRF